MNEHVEPGPAAAPAAPASQASLRLQALHDQELEELRAVIAQLLMQSEFLLQRHTGGEDLEHRVVQLREANEHLVLATFSAQDKQASAEALMQRQSIFLSMLAHELRNPLQPIRYANNLMGKLTGDMHELPRLQAIIERQLGNMTRLIDDLLDASRISSGKIGLDKSAVLLADIVALAVETSQPQIEARQQQLRIALPAAPVHIHGDRMRLAQALSNLLNNAAKFSPEHETIELQAQTIGGTVQIVVRDHGMGIAAELQPRIFELFTQGLQSLDRAQGGLGIGLALVRSLVEMHGGTIQVHSEGAGLGSTFTVLLPLGSEVSAAPVASPPPMPLSRGRRILLVEDNLDAAGTLALLLELRGHAVQQCHDGAAAVALALAGCYDLVISDIGLPGLDGYTVVERIRAALPGHAPVFIATSGYDQPQDRARAMLSGFDHYLVKPVAIDMLLALIEPHVH